MKKYLLIIVVLAFVSAACMVGGYRYLARSVAKPKTGQTSRKADKNRVERSPAATPGPAVKNSEEVRPKPTPKPTPRPLYCKAIVGKTAVLSDGNVVKKGYQDAKKRYVVADVNSNGVVCITATGRVFLKPKTRRECAFDTSGGKEGEHVRDKRGSDL